MDEEDDFFGSQSDSNEKAAGQRELEVVQGRFRASGYREAFTSTKEQALQVWKSTALHLSTNTGIMICCLPLDIRAIAFFPSTGRIRGGI
mmetsp:Transcript_14015/g.56445  ORF Transcript_14015/g.56445 Transcript_14015/m.56445 type:complete len:90 (+) Transcript_14015:154-423(+)